MTRNHRGYDPIKRTFDLIVASALLAISLPIQFAIASAIRKKLGSPILFRQDRPGRDGKVFELIKFRTMLDANPGEGVESDAARLTPLGKKLRALSLDELPTLVNVVRGEMSLVGPRPLLVSYLDRYTPEQARRHEVRPGITGLAQVSGRNSLDWNQRFKIDVEYVDRRTFWLDLSILLRTIVPVARQAGISADGETTMVEFKGDAT